MSQVLKNSKRIQNDIKFQLEAENGLFLRLRETKNLLLEMTNWFISNDTINSLPLPKKTKKAWLALKNNSKTKNSKQIATQIPGTETQIPGTSPS